MKLDKQPQQLPIPPTCSVMLYIFSPIFSTSYSTSSTFHVLHATFPSPLFTPPTSLPSALYTSYSPTLYISYTFSSSIPHILPHPTFPTLPSSAPPTPHETNSHILSSTPPTPPASTPPIYTFYTSLSPTFYISYSFSFYSSYSSSTFYTLPSTAPPTPPGTNPHTSLTTSPTPQPLRLPQSLHLLLLQHT